MSHHDLAAITTLLLSVNGEQKSPLIVDDFCNVLRFNPTLNQLEIAVEDMIIQDENIELFPLNTSCSISATTAEIAFRTQNELSRLEHWLNRHIDCVKIY